jgi:hypothetical protein
MAQDRDLPVSEAGDLFVIHDTGAHSHSMGFQYNGKLRAPEVLIRSTAKSAGAFSSSKTFNLIRERETIHCLYDNTVMPDDLWDSALFPSGLYPYAGRPPAPHQATQTFAGKTQLTALAVTAAPQSKPVDVLFARAASDSPSKLFRGMFQIAATVALAGVVVLVANDVWRSLSGSARTDVAAGVKNVSLSSAAQASIDLGRP